MSDLTEATFRKTADGVWQRRLPGEGWKELSIGEDIVTRRVGNNRDGSTRLRDFPKAKFEWGAS